MKALIYNRILLLLGFIGLFIAGFLSIAHRLNADIPCGADTGCNRVTTDASAYWGGIPVAYIGVGAYLVLTILAMVRVLKGAESTRGLVMPGYFIAAIGTVGSLYLQYQSLFVLRALCTWCMASAITMVLTLIFYALLAQSTEEQAKGSIPPDSKGFPMVVGLLLTLFVALGASGVKLSSSARESVVIPDQVKEQIAALIPEDAHVTGGENARITIIEFADMYCPSCRRTGLRLKEFLEKNPNQVKLVYRHFPLMEQHPMALPAALISEIAGEKGKFWDFMYAHYAIDGTEEIGVPALYDIAESVGLEKEEIKRRIDDEKDPIYERVQRDIALSNRLGLRVTPTFIMMVDDKIEHIGSSNDIFDRLQASPFREAFASR